ncbi:alkaline phosphatase D family protein [Paraburkholderia hospita]|uniref:alkaline phosphatase D family protein n=1 Tax=Paraburkholderia hospita TaxID=169430 RepID=UPI001F608860|nr:alkaline phosphatase D family protein [Paraburkholderia hospita]
MIAKAALTSELAGTWAGVDLSAIAPAPSNVAFVLDCDARDRYPSRKADLMSFLKTRSVTNVVAITCDLHAFQAGIARDVPNPATGTPVMIDLMAAGISSQPFFEDVKVPAAGMPLASLISSSAAFDAFVRQNNRDMLYADHDGIDYASATVTPTQFVIDFNKVKFLHADGTAPQSPPARRTRLTINSGTVASWWNTTSEARTRMRPSIHNSGSTRPSCFADAVVGRDGRTCARFSEMRKPANCGSSGTLVLHISCPRQQEAPPTTSCALPDVR